MPTKQISLDGSFDPEAVRVLTSVFEEAWRLLEKDQALEIGPETDDIHVMLVKSIIHVAREGERDPLRLREAALAHLAKLNGGQRPAP